MEAMSFLPWHKKQGRSCNHMVSGRELKPTHIQNRVGKSLRAASIKNERWALLTEQADRKTSVFARVGMLQT